MPNRFYRPSTPQYTSQFVEDKYPLQEMLVSQRYKAAKREQVASQYGQLEALNASITAGARTQDITPTVKDYWNKRLAEGADKMSGMSIQEQTRNLSRLRTEWMSDPNVQLIRRDREEGDPEYAALRRSKTYGTDIKPFWSEEEGRVKQFDLVRGIEGYEGMEEGQAYRPYETMTYTADYSQPINQLLRSIPTDTKTERGTETQVIEGKRYSVPWTQRVGYRNLEKDKKAIKDQAQNIWDDRETGDWQSYMVQGRKMKGVEDVYDYLVNEYSKLEQRIEYGDRSYIGGYKPEKEEPSRTPSEALSLEPVGEQTGLVDVDGMEVDKEGYYTFGPKGLTQTILKNVKGIDTWVAAFEKHPELSDKIDKAITNWDTERGRISRIMSEVFPGWSTAEKGSMAMVKGLIDIAAKQKKPELTDDMFVYLDQIQKEHPELLKNLNIRLDYKEQTDDQGRVIGTKWDIDASDADIRKGAEIVKDYLNESANSMYAPVEHWFFLDPKKHNERETELNKLYGAAEKTNAKGETFYAMVPGFNQTTRNIRKLNGLRDDLYNWKDLEKEYKLDAITITGELGPENYQHPWPFVYEPVPGDKKAEGVRFTRVNPAFNMDANEQESIDRLQAFIRFNFINDILHNTQIFPTKPSDYTELEGYEPDDIDTSEKKLSIMINKRMPFISMTYNPKEGYVINSVDPSAREESDRNKHYYGKTREMAFREYLLDN